MSCHELREQLSAYLDGMLDSSLAAQVEEHLASCAECRMEYEELKAAVELVRELPVVVPPPEFHAALRQRLQKLSSAAVNPETPVQKPGAPWKNRLRPLAAAAVIFLVAGVSALWYGQHHGGMTDLATREGQKRVVRSDQREHQPAGDMVALTTGREQATKPETGSQNLSGKIGSPPGGNRDAATGQAGQIAMNSEKDNSSTVTSRPGESAGREQGNQVNDLSINSKMPAGDLPRDRSAESEPRLFIMQAPGETPGETGDLDGNQDKISETTPQSGPVEPGPPVVREYEATLITGRDDAAGLVAEIAGRYGGYVASAPREPNEVWTLFIPVTGVDLFLDELKQLGKTSYVQNPAEITAESGNSPDQLQGMAVINLTISIIP